jgi:hypothetical protein
MCERSPTHIDLDELLIADRLREASIKADLLIFARLKDRSSFPEGYDFTELLAHIEHLERFHNLQRYSYTMPIILDWAFLKDLWDLMFKRMFGSLRRAPETGDWTEWLDAGLASFSLLMLCLRKGNIGRPSLVHLARVLKFVNV